MTVGMLLDMAAAGFGDRVLVGTRSGGMTGRDLARAASGGATEIRAQDAGHVAFLGVNSPAVPVTVLAACLAGVPVTPLNYRLAPDALTELLGRLSRPFLIGDKACLEPLDLPAEVCRMHAEVWPDVASAADLRELPHVDDESTAVVLFTSGTTSAPKGVVLRHSHLVSYVLQTVEFGSAAEDEAALISIPPYHVAGIGTILTNLYAGRRTVHLTDFTAQGWLDTVRTETITSAMLVPTMLNRVVEYLCDRPADVPTLRTIAYGGARMPAGVIRRALAAFPGVGFTNAYGLTETSSTIAVLGPDDHREAASSDDPEVSVRLESAGRFVPGIEGQIRGEDGTILDPGQFGELWVRGPQVSGEYSGIGSTLDAQGWFPTRDRARIDSSGYLFIGGRADDTIIRGGENIAPAEIEDVLLSHPGVADAAVFGAPDDDWGARIVAVLVLRDPGADEDPDAYRDFVRARLRSSRTPDEVVFVDELPYSATGKLMRTQLPVLLTGG